MKDALKKNPRLVDERNSAGVTPLMASCGKDRNHCVHYLLHSGAATLTITDNLGNTALHLAAGTGSLRAINVLLDYVFQRPSFNELIECRNRAGETALVLAVSNNHVSCVKALLSSGADQNAQDRNGQTLKDVAHLKRLGDIKHLLNNFK